MTKIPGAADNSGIWSSLAFVIGASVFLAYLSQKEVDHKPQKYKISHMALWGFILNSAAMTSYMWLGSFLVTMGVGLQWCMSMFISIQIKVSKSMAGTREIDAIAWLLKTAPPSNLAELFKKAGQLAIDSDDSIGFHYRPRLLESLMPFLSQLIISHHAPKHPSSESNHSPSSEDEDAHLENLGIYTACLARLSDFTDSEGSFKCLWEDVKKHPNLEKPLVDKLKKFTHLDPSPPTQPEDTTLSRRFQLEASLKSAAAQILINYNIEGISIPRSEDSEAPGTIVRSHGIATLFGFNLPRQAELEPSHSSGDPDVV